MGFEVACTSHSLSSCGSQGFGASCGTLSTASCDEEMELRLDSTCCCVRPNDLILFTALVHFLSDRKSRKFISPHYLLVNYRNIDDLLYLVNHLH